MSISKATQAADNVPLKLVSARLYRKEQERALINFYLDPIFRGAVEILRRMIPTNSSLRDEKVRKVFLSRARMILSRWGLHKFPHQANDNYKWLAWLWRHWDMEAAIRPTLPANIREPQLAPWTIQYLEAPLNFSADATHHRCHENAWVTITFFPGISRAQAMKAADQAYDLASRPMKGKTVMPLKGGRPGATESEVEALFRIFNRVGLPGKARGQRPADKLRTIRKAIEDSPDSSVNSLPYWSDSTIANYYRKWRTRNGASPRRYHKDPVRK